MVPRPGPQSSLSHSGNKEIFPPLLGAVAVRISWGEGKEEECRESPLFKKNVNDQSCMIFFSIFPVKFKYT